MIGDPDLTRRGSTRTIGALTVGAGVVLISVDGLLIRLMTQTLPFVDVLFWRGVGVTIGFTAIAWFVSRGSIAKFFLDIGRPGLVIALVNLCGYALFVISITHTTVAHSLLIVSAAPVLTAILAQILLHERAGTRTLVLSVAVAIGVALVFLAIPSRGDLLGDVAAAGTALCLSLNLVIVRYARRVNMIPAMAIGGVLTALASAPFVTRFTLSPREAALAFILGVVILPISLTLILRGPRYLQAPDVSLLILLETVLGPLWVLIAIHEVPDLRTVLSGSVILAALAANAVGEQSDLRRMRARGVLAASEPAGSAALPRETTKRRE